MLDLQLIGYLTTPLEAGVLVVSLSRKCFRRYLPLNLYMAVCVVVDLLRYHTVHHYGFHSAQYYYLYYYSDALITIFLYFSVIGLFSLVLREMKIERYLRLFALLLLAGTAFFAYEVVAQSGQKLTTRYALELSQDVYFVGLVLVYLLWGAVLKLPQTSLRLVQLALSLGVYFSAFAANYALGNMYPNLYAVWVCIPFIMGLLLPLSWLFAFLKLSEEKRLTPAQLTTARVAAR